jgi:hypothetical protein
VRTFLGALIVLIELCHFAAPSRAFVDDPNRQNAVSQRDYDEVSRLWKRALKFNEDFIQITVGIAKSAGPASPQVWCADLINTQAQVLNYHLYATTVALGMSVALQYRLDEVRTLGYVKSAVDSAAKHVASARVELNQALGGCAQRSRITYDKTKELLELNEGLETIIIPILRRVEAAGH